MAGPKISFSVDSYAGFALGPDKVWLNPAADWSTLPEYLLHEVLHCSFDQLKREGKLTFNAADEEAIVGYISKNEVAGLKHFFCKPKLRKGIADKMTAARKRLQAKEEWE